MAIDSIAPLLRSASSGSGFEAGCKNVSSTSSGHLAPSWSLSSQWPLPAYALPASGSATFLGLARSAMWVNLVSPRTAFRAGGQRGGRCRARRAARTALTQA
jgi:hypothetical protein